MSYKIELSDGTLLENLTLNGDNFISYHPIEFSLFEHNMSPVKITTNDPESTFSSIEIGVHDNMDLVQITHEEDSNEWWFVLRDVSESELQYAKTRADIEYLAMMADVEL